MIDSPQTEEKKQSVVITQSNGTVPVVGDGFGGMTKEGAKLDTRYKTEYSIGVNIKELEKELRKSVSGEVRFDDGSRALYSTDASNYRQIPIGVVLPKTEEDIVNTINICKKYNAPLVNRGGGTSLAGQGCNVAVMMDMSKYYNQILNIDKDKKFVFYDAFNEYPRYDKSVDRVDFVDKLK